VDDRVEVCQGLFCDTFKTLEKRDLKFAFVHIDANIYQGTLEACQFTVPRISSGGAVVFDDYNGPCDLGARLAIDQFFSGREVRLLPLAGSSVWLRAQRTE
jgi:O-methyltransferase